MAYKIRIGEDTDFRITNNNQNVDVTIDGNVVITNDLTIQGATTTIDTTNVTVEDPLMILGSGNATDSLDLGFIGIRASDNAALIWGENLEYGSGFGAILTDDDGTTSGSINILSYATFYSGGQEIVSTSPYVFFTQTDVTNRDWGIFLGSGDGTLNLRAYDTGSFTYTHGIVIDHQTGKITVNGVGEATGSLTDSVLDVSNKSINNVRDIAFIGAPSHLYANGDFEITSPGYIKLDPGSGAGDDVIIVMDTSDVSFTDAATSGGDSGNGYISIEINGTSRSIPLGTSGGGGSYTDEDAQDAVGNILVDDVIVWTYDDATPQITATLAAGSVTETMLDINNAPSADGQVLTWNQTSGYMEWTASYTSENAQDDVGGILVDTSTINFTYDDATPQITASVIANSIPINDLSDVDTATSPPSTDYTLRFDGSNWVPTDLLRVNSINSEIVIGTNADVGLLRSEANILKVTDGTAGEGSIVSLVPVNTQTGTSYTVQASDNGKIITLDNASAITLTIPDGLPQGFNFGIIQLGAGQVSVTMSGTDTLNSPGGSTSLAQQFSSGSLTHYTATDWHLTGDLA